MAPPLHPPGPRACDLEPPVRGGALLSGLRMRLLLPFVAFPVAALVLVGGLGWWLSGRLVERSVDRMVGDKLELIGEVVRQIADEQLQATSRRAGGAVFVAVSSAPGDVRLLSSSLERDEWSRLRPQIDALVGRDGAEGRFTLVQSGNRFLGIAAVRRPGTDDRLLEGRVLPADLPARFTALTGAEMGLFASWGRASAASFAVDLTVCRGCHDDGWRVQRIGESFHATRSFRGRAYFTKSLGDGFRYAFMPLELNGRRVAMGVVRLPLEPATAARMQSLALLGGAGVLVLGISLVTWWRLSAGLTAPIVALERWLESVGRGGAAAQPRITTRDELGRLAESMSVTVTGLRESRDRLNQVNAELGRMVTSQSERLGTFLELASAPERVPDPDDVGRDILAHVVPFLGVAWARMVFVDPIAEAELHRLQHPARGRPDGAHAAALLAAARRSPTPFRAEPDLVAAALEGEALVAPLVLRGRTFGALAVAARAPGHLGTLGELAHQAAMALEHSFLYAQAQQAYLHTTAVLVKTIEEKDHYLRGHSDRVARMAMATAPALGITNGALRSLELLARFHDVGKICIDSSVLLKPGRLTPEEFQAITRHTNIGEAIVSQLAALGPQAHVIGQHHERYDGGGYPRRVAGTDIALEARVIAVADSFDAMTSLRPYRPPLAAAAALDEITAQAGRQFDPAVVAAFVEAGAGQLGFAAA